MHTRKKIKSMKHAFMSFSADLSAPTTTISTIESHQSLTMNHNRLRYRLRPRQVVHQKLRSLILSDYAAKCVVYIPIVLQIQRLTIAAEYTSLGVSHQ